MDKIEWNRLSIGDTVHMSDGTRFFISTVELLGTEKKPDGIGDVFDRSGQKLTFDDIRHGTVTKCPPTLPVIDGRVIFPGDRKWPRLMWPYHPDAKPGDDKEIHRVDLYRKLLIRNQIARLLAEYFETSIEIGTEYATHAIQHIIEVKGNEQ